MDPSGDHSERGETRHGGPASWPRRARTRWPNGDRRCKVEAIASPWARGEGDGPRQLHQFTRAYPLLQGLRILPWAAPVLVFWGVKSGTWTQGWPRSFWIAVAAAAVASLGAHVHYRRAYGQVRRRLDDRRFIGWSVLIVVVPALLVAMSALGGLRAPLLPAFGLRGALFGAAVFIAYLVVFGPLGSTGPVAIRWYASALMVMACLPVGWLPGLDGRHPMTWLGAMSLMFAGLVMVAGVSGHRALRRCLGASGLQPAPDSDVRR